MNERELVIIPTYHRPELLFYCITLIRAFEREIPIVIFPDRGTYYDTEIQSWRLLDENTHVVYVPEHNFHGNSYNTMEAFRWAFNTGAEVVYLIEDDVMIHPDFFKWHREMHEEIPDLFASMAWIFNRYAPITEDPLFQPWYYSIGTCFKRNKLELIARHASPLYYADMQGYIEEVFKASNLNSPYGIEHYEQDGLIQRILDVDRTQTVTCGIAKCTHLGIYGYNRGWNVSEEFFSECISFEQRVERIKEFLGDPYWRSEVFGRDIVEREIGRELPPRTTKYKVIVGDWESDYVAERGIKGLRRVNSVPVTAEMKFVITS